MLTKLGQFMNRLCPTVGVSITVSVWQTGPGR